MFKRFTDQLSWSRIVAMAVLVLAVIVLSIIDAKLAWQKYLATSEPQTFTISEEKVAELVQTQPEFVDWVANDLSDEDGGILNLQDTGRTARVR